MHILPTQKGMGMQLSTRDIKVVPLRQTGCHVVLRQRIEARVTRFEQMDVARSHSDVSRVCWSPVLLHKLFIIE
ncbi:hypothetical protein [Coleofasciculus sp. E1-EBD-02]|uniref:hypothetical protein n=1 Tax=Coleofasciculus sp. E1-EBD-02 TaxID=3068481 RepID=UPI003303D00E